MSDDVYESRQRNMAIAAQRSQARALSRSASVAERVAERQAIAWERIATALEQIADSMSLAAASPVSNGGDSSTETTG